MVGSFLTGNQQEQKIKKQRVNPISVNMIPAATISATIPVSEADREDGMVGGHGLQNSGTPRPNIGSNSPFRRENWANMHTVQDLRNSTTDINISLPGG